MSENIRMRWSLFYSLSTLAVIVTSGFSVTIRNFLHTVDPGGPSQNVCLTLWCLGLAAILFAWFFWMKWWQKSLRIEHQPSIESALVIGTGLVLALAAMSPIFELLIYAALCLGSVIAFANASLAYGWWRISETSAARVYKKVSVLGIGFLSGAAILFGQYAIAFIE